MFVTLAPASEPPTYKHIDREGAQTHVVVGTRAVAHGDPRRFALLLLSNLVISYTNLFRNREASFLLTAPVSWQTVFRWKLSQQVYLKHLADRGGFATGCGGCCTAFWGTCSDGSSGLK